eukprot:4494807-Pyramimonas_sp.AAC.2
MGMMRRRRTMRRNMSGPGRRRLRMMACSPYPQSVPRVLRGREARGGGGWQQVHQCILARWPPGPRLPTN